jgi:hypothetical protein
MKAKQIIQEIEYDIEKGIYKDFPILKNRLAIISSKLLKSIYVVNAEKLSVGDIQTLILNEYLKIEEIQEL